MIRSATATLILTLASQLAQADTLSEALAAKQRGDAAAAYPLWVKLAEQGDHKAALEVGLMHHLGQGVPQDYGKAMDWYLKAIDKNGDAVNNIGVMYRDGLGVDKNRKVAHALFLTVHLTGMGGESTVMRANRNLRREIAELPLADRQESVCYSLKYLLAFVESKGKLQGIPDDLKAAPDRKRIKDLDTQLPGGLGEFICPAHT